MKRTSAKPKRGRRKTGPAPGVGAHKGPAADKEHGREHPHQGWTLEEKQVLTVLDDAPVEDFVHFVARFVDLSSERIRRIVDRLQKEDLVEILEDNDILRFFHTKKVTKDMLDAALEHTVRYGPAEAGRVRLESHG